MHSGFLLCFIKYYILIYCIYDLEFVQNPYCLLILAKRNNSKYVNVGDVFIFNGEDDNREAFQTLFIIKEKALNMNG